MLGLREGSSRNSGVCIVTVREGVRVTQNISPLGTLEMISDTFIL